jgi:murein DD-endopeptidase MepM/ murein hydrolase activator NlpD
VEQQIKVTARGEFTQLARGLKELQRDLDNVTNQIDKATKKGGVFGDGSELAALDLYRKRFLATMEEVDREFDKQNKIVEELEAKMSKASMSERRNIQQEIREREKKLDQLRREIMYMEQLYKRRNNEASTYKTPGQGGGGGGNAPDANALNEAADKSMMGTLGKRLLTKGMGLAKGGLALAGIGGIGAILSQAYQSAYRREVGSLDIAQRIRGFGGYSGSNVNIYDQMQNIGMKDKMGYTGADVGQFMDMYSRRAGVMSQSSLETMLKFSRGYGLDLGETAGAVSSVQRLGGATSPQKFADMIAASVSKSGMTPRILEVMETNAELLQTINTTLKDGQATTILAYQTTLDRLGNENGMSKLTGQAGAGIISGLNGIFSPDNDQWKWMGIRALQSYNPGKYGGMDLYGLETAFEDGLNNADNLPAMMKYIKTISGGNQSLEKRILQKWLQQGGYNATKQQVNDLYEVTGGMTAFDQDKMNGVIQQLQGGNAGAKYSERENEGGQNILNVEAQYQKALQGIGSEFLGIITNLKGGVAEAMQSLTEGLDAFTNAFDKWFDDFIDSLPEGWKKAAEKAFLFIEQYWDEAAALTMAAIGLFKGVSWVKDLAKKMGVDVGTPPSNSLNKEVGAKLGADGMPVEEGTKMRGTGILGPDGKEIMAPFEDAAKSTVGDAAKSGWRAAIEGAGKGAMTAGKMGLKAGSDILFLNDLFNVFTDQIARQNTGRRLSEFNDELDKFNADPANKDKPFFGEGGEIRADDRSWWQKTVTDPFKNKMYEWKDYIQHFGDKGDSEIGQMPKDIKEFSQDGSDSLAMFADKGEDHLKSMDTNTQAYLGALGKNMKQTLDSIYSEHRGFKTMMFQMFQPVVQYLRTLGSGGSGSAGGSWGGKFNQFINEAAQMYGVDPNLIAAVIQQESGFNPNARSSAGAIGLMQLMPQTAAWLGVDDPYDPRQNIMGGAKYLSRLMSKYGNVEDALAAYNAGEGRTDQYVEFGKPLPSETQKYIPAVMGYYNQFKSKGGSAGAFWNNWRSRVTSRFGDTEGRDHPHQGLDIDGMQGDALSALTDGVISFIKMDDGGANDPDHKMNTNEGGTQVGVRMADGSTYFYAHMSGVNPNLKVGDKVNAGDFIGNMGGDPGKPGSGYGTTGSHLHLGYMDANGILRDPEELLNGLGIGRDQGDSEIGQMVNAVTQSSLKNTPQVTGGSNSTLTIKLEMEPTTAQTLSKQQIAAFEKIAKQVFEQATRMKVQVNPSTTGW